MQVLAMVLQGVQVVPPGQVCHLLAAQDQELLLQRPHPLALTTMPIISTINSMLRKYNIEMTATENKT